MVEQGAAKAGNFSLNAVSFLSYLEMCGQLAICNIDLYIIMKALNGFLMTQRFRQLTLKDMSVCYVSKFHWPRTSDAHCHKYVALSELIVLIQV